MKTTLAGALPLLVLSACASATPFSAVIGNVRVTGDVTSTLFARNPGNVSVRLYDASTGYPVDANVEVQAGKAPPVHAAKQQLGIYGADVASMDTITVLVTTKDGRGVLALKQR